MALDTSVRYYDSEMAGLPGALSGTAGALVTNVFDPCLVNGFNSMTLTSLVVNDGVVTATKTSHGITAILSSTMYPVIRISGSTVTGPVPGALNGDFRITGVTANTFTFATSGVANQTATGTITAKIAPAGYETLFTATNKRAYRSLDIRGGQRPFRIDDTPAQYPVVRLYESMSNIDTGVNGTTASAWLSKSDTADSNFRMWRLISDGLFWYFFSASNYGWWTLGVSGGAVGLPIVFGDDSYASLVILHTTQSPAYTTLYVQNSTSGRWTLRNYLNAVGAAAFTSSTKAVHAAEPPYPAVTKAVLVPSYIQDNAYSVIRGYLPGIYWCTSVSTSIPDGELFTGIDSLPGRTLYTQRVATDSYKMHIDITGPWR